MKKIIFIILIICSCNAFAVDELRFFGYMQPLFWTFKSNDSEEGSVAFNTGGISQANFFVQANFQDNLSAFVNFELINNFSTDKNWGAFNLQEAYLKWDYNNYLQVKFGQVIPQFNNMFEIYNRTPILPYLLRPKLYEATLGNLVDIFDILPQRALVHLNGYAPLSEDIKMDYAFYINHAVNKFHSNPNNDLLPYYVAFGQSAERYLGYGGRLGFRWKDLKVGASASADVGNYRKFKWTGDGDIADLGDLGRMRLGADLSLDLGPFTFAGGLLVNNVKINDNNSVTFNDIYDANKEKTMQTKEFLTYAHSKNKQMIGNELGKMFYFATLTYRPTENTFIYVMYDYLDDKTDPYYFGTSGYKGYSIGGGWNINEDVVIKAQYVRNNANFDIQQENNSFINSVYNERYFVIGTSISF